MNSRAQLDSTPALGGIDHIHVFVADRAGSEDWYRQVLGLRRVAELELWASDGGLLTLGNASGTVHLALFERPAQSCRSTIAFAVSGAEFSAWQRHLALALNKQMAAVDHQIARSLYFSDPDGNPFEITTYDPENGSWARAAPSL